MRKVYVLTLLFFLTPLLLIAQRSPLKVAGIEEANVSTSHPYNPDGKKGVVLKKEFHKENATHIRLYFENFQLQGDDHLEIRSPETGESFIYAGGGKVIDREGNTISDFWSRTIHDDEAIVRLHSTSRALSYGFDITEVAYGYPEDSIESGAYEATCGTDDKRDKECYSGTTMYDKSDAVCRLSLPNGGSCTGWLIGDQGHVLTNNHCISSSTEAQNTDFEFNFRDQTCGGSNTTTRNVVSGGTLICTDADLDYSLIELSTNPVSSQGYLEMRASGPITGERIYIPQHPRSRPKEFAVDDDQSSTGLGKIQNTSGVNGAGLPTRVEYFTDTEGGSSGSPVIGYDDHNVVALHNTAGCENGGNRVDEIISDMGACLPSNAIDSVLIAGMDASPFKSCNGEVNFTDRSSNADSSVWYFGDGDSSHATSPTHTYTSSGSYTPRLVVWNSQGNSDTAETDLSISYVEKPSAPNDTICPTGSATLTATASGDNVLWYEAPNGTPLDTGTFKTGPISSDSIFYVIEEEKGITSQKVGPVDTNFHSGKYFDANDNWGTTFDAHKPLVLESVKVYSDYAGNRRIEIIKSGSVIASKVVYIGIGSERIELNFEVPRGSGYLLKATEANGNPVSLFRNGGGSNYPYEVPGLISITGNNTTSGNADDYYYYFYDWEVHEERCRSTWNTVEVITEKNGLDANAGSGPSTGDCEGSVWADPQGGVAPYDYQWDVQGAGNTSSIDSLCSGTYTVIVSDANGCRDTSEVTVDRLTSLEDREKRGEWRLRPVPANDRLTLERPKGGSGNEVTLTFYNMVGKAVLQKTLDGGKSRHSIQLADLAEGVYILDLKGEGIREQFKVPVTRGR